MCHVSNLVQAAKCIMEGEDWAQNPDTWASKQAKLDCEVTGRGQKLDCEATGCSLCKHSSCMQTLYNLQDILQYKLL